MEKVPTFGFSAFLKLISQNDKPQKSALKRRFAPSKGGYDFHKSLRASIQQVVENPLAFGSIFESLNTIKKSAERNSAKNGLKNFQTWRQKYPGNLESADSIIISSPNNIFKVSFTPDFVIELNGRRTGIHIWNTKSKLSSELVLATLSLVAKNYDREKRQLDDFGVLSLQNNSFYRWSEDPQHGSPKAQRLLLHIEKQCTMAKSELGIKDTSRPEVIAPTFK